MSRGRKPTITALNGALEKSPAAPSWLPKHGKAEWSRVVPALVKSRSLASHELSTVESYCIAVARIRETEAYIQKHGMTYVSPTGEQKRAPQTTIPTLYARYSSVMQDGSSIDGQILACRKIADQWGLKIVGVPFEDRAKSGQSEDGRDGYAALLAGIRKRDFDVVVVDDLILGNRKYIGEIDWNTHSSERSPYTKKSVRRINPAE